MADENQIDVNAFLQARAAEIKYLEQKLKTSTKKSLLHQRLPFHKRRRKRSENGHNNKISKKTKRKRKQPYLRTHIWFAKRFQMLSLFGTHLPYLRNEKSDKFIYKSSDRGFVFDESFKNVYVLKLKSNLVSPHQTEKKNTDNLKDIENNHSESFKDEINCRSKYNTLFTTSNDKNHGSRNSLNESKIDSLKTHLHEGVNTKTDDNFNSQKNQPNNSRNENLNRHNCEISHKNQVDHHNTHINESCNDIIASKIEATISSSTSPENQTTSYINKNPKDLEAMKLGKYSTTKTPGVIFKCDLIQSTVPTLNSSQEMHFFLKNDIFDPKPFLINKFHTIGYIDNDHIGNIDICPTEEYLIVVSMPSDDFPTLFSNYEVVKKHDCCLSLIQGTRNLMKTGVYNDFFIQDKQINDYINELISPRIKENGSNFSYCFIQSSSTFEKGKILVHRDHLMHLWQFIFNNGIIPISLTELLRLGLETNNLVYPFDSIYSKYYKEYERSFYGLQEAKFLRTPVSKRHNYQKFGCENPFYLPEDVLENTNLYTTKFFIAEKGSITRMATIYSKDIVVGFVLRGGYAFRKGRSSGVCILKNTSLEDILYAKNTTSKIKYIIKLV